MRPRHQIAFAVTGSMFFMLLSALPCRGQQEEDRIVLGGVEVCGPAASAIDYLKPRDRKSLKRWEKEQRHNRDKNSVIFHSWNSAVAWVPMEDGRWIGLTIVQGRVSHVMLTSFANLVASADYRSWEMGLEAKYGASDSTSENAVGMMFKNWHRPNGIRIDLGTSGGDNPLTTLIFTCVELPAPGVDDIF